MRLLFVLILLLLPFAVARAQDQSALCALMPAHKPSAGVEYQPGVDVYGRPVAPADMNAPATQMVPDVVRVPLTIDLAQRFGGALPTGTQLETQMGMIEIHRNGRVTYNGHDLTTAAQKVCNGATIPASPAAENAQAQEKPRPRPQPQKIQMPAPGDIIYGEGH